MADEKTEYEETNEAGQHGVGGLPAGMTFTPPLVPKDAEKTGAAAVVRPDSEAAASEGAAQPASDMPEDQTVRTTRRGK